MASLFRLGGILATPVPPVETVSYPATDDGDMSDDDGGGDGNDDTKSVEAAPEEAVAMDVQEKADGKVRDAPAVVEKAERAGVFCC